MELLFWARVVKQITDDLISNKYVLKTSVRSLSVLAWPLASFQKTDKVTYLLKVQVSLATWAKTPYWRCVALSLLAQSCGGRLLTWATSWHHFSCLPQPVPSCLDLLISFQMHAAVDQPGRHQGPTFAWFSDKPRKPNLKQNSLFFLWKSHVLTGIYGAILEACALLFSLGTYTRLSKQPRHAPWKDNPPPPLPSAKNSHIPKLCIFAFFH